MNEELIKNVDLKQCVFIIISSVIALTLVLLMPVTFGAAGADMTISALGNGALSGAFELAGNGLEALLGFPGATFASLMTILVYAFIFFMVANIVFSVLLLILKNELLRYISRIVSFVNAGFMILLSIFCLLHIIGVAGLIIMGIVPLEEVMSAIEKSGIILAIVLIIFSMRHSFKQFKWFTPLY